MANEETAKDVMDRIAKKLAALKGEANNDAGNLNQRANEERPAAGEAAAADNQPGANHGANPDPAQEGAAEHYEGKIAVSIKYETNQPVAKLYKDSAKVLGQTLNDLITNTLERPGDLNDPTLVRNTQLRIKEAFNEVNSNNDLFVRLEVSTKKLTLDAMSGDVLNYVIRDADLIKKNVAGLNETDYKTLEIFVSEPKNGGIYQ